MTRVLITGSSGFVGNHLWDYLQSIGFQVYGIDRVPDPERGGDIITCDLLDREGVFRLIPEIAPDYVFHLAAQSSVRDSWENPKRTFEINVGSTKNLLDAIANAGIRPRMLVISSSQVYGVPEKIPIDESHPLKPNNPYAESKLGQERVCRDYDLDVVISRSFNHTGPGQPPSFVCSDFAKQIAEISSGIREPVMYVGNLSARRDFTDVRDMVEAYLLAIEKCDPDVYNICSGRGYSIREILDVLMRISGADIEVKQKRDRMRLNDIDILVGSNKKFCAKTGWTPQIEMDKTLSDLYDYWIKMLG